LTLAGTSANPAVTKETKYIEKIFNKRLVTEIIHPIILEKKFLGTAHVTYYPDYKNTITQEHIRGKFTRILLYI
jgi:hypothetical protein